MTSRQCDSEEVVEVTIILLKTSLMSLVCAVMLWGCQALKPDLHMRLQTGPRVNADVARLGTALPIRIYQLSHADTWRLCSEQTLWQHDRTCLGDALLSRHSLLLLPGQSRRWQQPWLTKTRAIGVVAFYRQSVRGTRKRLLSAKLWRHWLSFSYRVHASQTGLN